MRCKHPIRMCTMDLTSFIVFSFEKGEEKGEKKRRDKKERKKKLLTFSLFSFLLIDSSLSCRPFRAQWLSIRHHALPYSPKAFAVHRFAVSTAHHSVTPSPSSFSLTLLSFPALTSKP